MKFILPLLLTFTTLLVQDIIAQDGYNITKYTSENGISHNNIKSIVKDKTGFIWLATFDGLSRFDGYEFRNYRHIPDDSTSIPNFDAGTICIDMMNNLWTLEANQIAKFNRAADNFDRYKIQSDSSGQIFSVSAATIDNEGKLWISGKGLKKYNYKSDNFETIRILDENGMPVSFSENIGYLDFDKNDVL